MATVMPFMKQKQMLLEVLMSTHYDDIEVLCDLSVEALTTCALPESRIQQNKMLM